MRIDRKSRVWIAGTSSVAAAAAACYALGCWSAGEWLGGSSLIGLSFGIAGGLIVLFEFSLWPRKQLRSRKLGRGQVWLRAHVWLGLLCLPLLLMHAGFRWGGPLSAVLLLLLLVVIGSGIVGAVAQHFLPTRLLETVPAETIYSQIDSAIEQLRKVADAIVYATCGTANASGTESRDDSTGMLQSLLSDPQAMVLWRSCLQTLAPLDQVPRSEALRDFHQQALRPFLEHGTHGPSPLKSQRAADQLFDSLVARVDDAARPAVAMLREFCEQRRQLDRQRRLHRWLHGWLLVHLPLSAALVVLMILHAWVALRYW